MAQLHDRILHVETTLNRERAEWPSQSTRLNPAAYKNGEIHKSLLRAALSATLHIGYASAYIPGSTKHMDRSHFARASSETAEHKVN